jgi:gas vesicle structural protein
MAALAQRYVAQQQTGRGGPSGLADVLEVLLDKGLVIDAFVRVSLIGIELLTVDARVVVASVDTYLRFAEAVNRLDLQRASSAQQLGDLVGGRGERHGGDGRSQARRGDGAAEGNGDAAEGRKARAGTADESREDESHEQALERGSEEPGRGPAESQEAEDDKGLLSRLKQRGQVF